MRGVLVLAALLVAVARSAGALEPPRANERWHKVVADDLVLVSNAEAAVLGEVAGDLIAVRPLLARASGLEVHAPVITTVYVFRSHSGFVAYRDAVLGEKSDAESVFLPLRDGNFVLVDGSRTATALRTPRGALAGSYLGSSIADLPPWLKEGLAQLVATATRTSRGLGFGSPDGEHVRVLQAQRAIPVATLLAATAATPELAAWSRHGVFAAEAWAVTRSLLLDGNVAGDRLPRFLAQRAAGRDLEGSLKEAFGTTLDELERRLKAATHGDPVPPLTFAAGSLGAPPAPAATEIPRDELLFLLGNLLAHTRPANTADAEAFLGAAIALNSSLAPAYAARAIVQTRLGLTGAAEADLEKAVALDSSDPRPTLYLADYLTERLADRVRAGATPSAGELERVRGLFRRSIALDGRRSRAWAGLGFSYLLTAGEAAEGIAALERCLELEGASFDAAYSLVLLYVRSGRRAEAAALIERVVRHAPNRALALQARDAVLVADLDRAEEVLAAGSPGEAIAILERITQEATSGKIRAEAASRLERARKQAALADQAVRFDEAVAKIRARDYRGAMAILKELEAVAVDADLLQAIAETESDILPFLAGPR